MAKNVMKDVAKFRQSVKALRGHRDDPKTKKAFKELGLLNYSANEKNQQSPLLVERAKKTMKVAERYYEHLKKSGSRR